LAFSAPSLLRRAAIDGVPRLLQLVWHWEAWPCHLPHHSFLRTLPLCCTGTARRSHTPPTILSPQVCRHRRLLQRKTRTDIARYHPTCHARGATESANVTWPTLLTGRDRQVLLAAGKLQWLLTCFTSVKCDTAKLAWRVVIVKFALERSSQCTEW
jgi:hypothetical protein